MGSRISGLTLTGALALVIVASGCNRDSNSIEPGPASAETAGSQEKGPTVVLDEARKNLANLADYGITADDLATTDTLLTVFETQLPETSVMQSQKVSGSKSKTDWFKEADAIIEKRLMRTAIKLKDIDNEFYQQLENAASPNEPYSQSTTIEVHVVGKASQKPATNADISIPELGMMATTNHQGVFISKIASKKNVSMQVVKMNHKPVVLEGLHLRKGKKNVFKLEIEEA